MSHSEHCHNGKDSSWNTTYHVHQISFTQWTLSKVMLEYSKEQSRANCRNTIQCWTLESVQHWNNWLVCWHISGSQKTYLPNYTFHLLGPPYPPDLVTQTTDRREQRSAPLCHIPHIALSSSPLLAPDILFSTLLQHLFSVMCIAGDRLLWTGKDLWRSGRGLFLSILTLACRDWGEVGLNLIHILGTLQQTYRSGVQLQRFRSDAIPPLRSERKQFRIRLGNLHNFPASLRISGLGM
jgi:hypothetical protein